MAQTVLVRALTSGMIEAGEALLRRLDDGKMGIVSAFWVYREESARWKLVLATPLAAETDGRLLYRKARLLLEEMGEARVKMADLMIVAPKYYLVQEYGYQVWRGRLPKNLIRHLDCGTYFIYRFLPLRLPSR